MITSALRHLAGIGPVRLAKLHECGVKTWDDVLQQPELLPKGLRKSILEECRNCKAALARNDIPFFAERLAPQDKWRILTQFLDQTSFFDIETAGLEYNSPITVIVCWHKGRLYSFVEHENLDDFLELLDDVQLLGSFNGSSFDVPRVLDAFHIPKLPCAHLDLRWLCFYHGKKGSLKDISVSTGIQRPPDLQNVDGEVAIYLWNRWQMNRDHDAREKLIRYCAADVLMLVLLASELVGRNEISAEELWALLPGSVPPIASIPNAPKKTHSGPAFGAGSPSKIRAWRRLVG